MRVHLPLFLIIDYLNYDKYFKYFYFMYRKQLKQAEEIVKIRSQAAEGRWCLDKFHKSSIGTYFIYLLFTINYFQLI